MSAFQHDPLGEISANLNRDEAMPPYRFVVSSCANNSDFVNYITVMLLFLSRCDGSKSIMLNCQYYHQSTMEQTFYVSLFF